MAHKIFTTNKAMKLNSIFYIFQIFLFINQIFFIKTENIDLTDTTILNSVITLNHYTWRAGNAATNKNGDFIIEYSLNPAESQSRLFYGLKKDGRLYFPNAPFFKEISSITCSDCGDSYKGRFFSLNLFVSLIGDATAKQYLFSMSSDNSVVELIDIENDFTHFAWKTTNFFSISNPINSYQYSLFEIGDTNNYIAVFIESAGTVTIKKFSIKAFASDNQKEIQTATITDGYNGRVVTAFRLDAIQLIVILYSRSTSLYFYYYNDNLEYQGQKHFYDVYNLNNVEGNFFKLIYMKDIYFALAFFQDRNSGSSLHFHLKKYVNMVDYDTLIHYYDFTDFQFRTDVQANGLYKLTDERVALFSTSEYNSNYFGLLHMFLIDFYNNFAEMKMREFRFYYSDKRFVKEMSAYDYNGYIFFSATLDNTDNSGNNIFSILMIFGFANGTDLTIDISPYLADSGNYNEAKNLYNDLMDTMTIDNNIFGYVKVEQIRLVSICNELLLYRGKSDSRETNTVPIGESFGSQYTLLQDKSRIKNEDTLYTLEYQFIVQEPDYTTFYSIPHATFDSIGHTYDSSAHYQPKTFYGRTNILKFKLCHNYCITCKEYGASNDDQKCIDCKEEYTYDYLAYLGSFTGNCVPQGQMYDTEAGKLIYCNTTSFKFYYNTSRNNETYCFKSSLGCPDIYNSYNEETNECFNYIPPPTTIPPPIPTTQEIKAITTFPVIPTTIQVIPTTLPDNPTTIPEMPTTIQTITTIPVIPTTIHEIPTTIPENPTTAPVIPTTIQIIPTTNPIITTEHFILTTFPEIITTTYIEEQCKYGRLINHTSIYSNLTNEEVYQVIKDDIISSYCTQSSSVIIEGSNGNSFHLTNTLNENRALEESTDVSAINLKECENILKNVYNISNSSLIILKFMKGNTRGDKYTYKYEVFNPYNFEVLNLSHCDNITIDVYVPLILDQKTEQIYNELMSQGYNPLDITDKFYTEICTPYTSENGTDVSLEDREEFIYGSLINGSLCPDGCYFSGYDSEKKSIKCECSAEKEVEQVGLDLKHLSGSNIYNSFLSTLQATNYIVIQCQKLVFSFQRFCLNTGSIVTLILLGVYVVFMIIYFIKGITPIKLHVSRLIFKEQKPNDINTINLIELKEDKKNKNRKSKPKSNALKTNKGHYPPKKEKNKKFKDDFNKEKHNSVEIYKSNDIKRNTNSRYSVKTSLKTLISSETKLDKINNEKGKKGKIDKKLEKKEDNPINIEKEKKLDNFELNNLSYDEAYELDKRSFFSTYFSVLMREHAFFLTFFAWNDYNLFYVKIDKFLILFCTDMTLNGLFFVHESMHKKYTLGEDFTFVQKIPQLVFTLLVSNILEVFLCFLSMTDVSVYEIKALGDYQKNGEKIQSILKCIKRKLVVFYIFTFLLFTFYWYFISSFCAVYKNTQKIFIRDSFLSFLTSAIEPFITYGVTSLLRIVSLLKCWKKNCFAKCIYKLSDLIPFF